MKLLVVLCCVVAACVGQVLVYQTPLVPYNHLAPLVGPVSTQFRAQDELGQFTFATAGDNQVVAARALFQKQYEQAARAAEATPDQTPSRRRRQAVLPLPLLVPAARTTVKVARYEPVDAAVPASTRKVELKEKEEEVLAAAPVHLPLAYTVPAVPAAPKAKVHQLEAVDAAVPAATRKLELREKEAELVPVLPLPAARFIVL